MLRKYMEGLGYCAGSCVVSSKEEEANLIRDDFYKASVYRT